MVTSRAAVYEQDLPPKRTRVSWGAIFAGTAVSLGLWVLLYAFGLAINFTALSPTDPDSLRAAGIGTGVWSVLAPLIALFVGGLVVSHESGVTRRLDGAIHGAVVWALAVLLGLFFIGSLVAAIVGGAARMVGGTVGTAAAAMGDASPMEALGLETRDLVEPINEQLRAEGRPEVTASGLQAALQDAVGEAVRTGQLSRRDVVAALSANTALSRQDAEAVATRIETQWGPELQQRAEGVAQTAADAAARTLWALSIALLLSLLAALGGAIVGVMRREKHLAETQPVGPGEPVVVG
jgi:hypothetical protein